MLRTIVSLSMLLFSALCQAAYVQDRDLISLHYDHAPDKDDGHATVAALAVVRSLGIQPHVVSAAYGQRNRGKYQPGAERVMQQTWGSGWVNAHNNWQPAVNATYNKWLATLSNGGDIWVAEGGQADFTADVVRRIKANNSSINTKARIHVVQHSTWNENQANQNDLKYVKSNTRYIKIADGNGANATADLNQKSASFVALAKASQHGAAWNAAFAYLNPNNKLDFSDTVELLHILGVGKNRVATVNDFGAVYISKAPVAQPGSPTPWSDSYSVDGQCYCDSTFDHGLSNQSVNTPAGSKTIPQVCADITSKFGAGSFNNRVYYNTVQCGHPPKNNANDEAICPGIPQSNNNYSGSRCQQSGAIWNLDLVYPTPVVVQPAPVVVQPAPVVVQPAPEPAPAPVVEPAPTPVAEQPAPAPVASQPTPPTVTTPVVFPTCSASAIDDNGDGYAWENNQSCIVAASTPPSTATPTSTAPATQQPVAEFPTCSSAASDFDGDGYAWENNQTCTVVQGAAPPATTTPPVVDAIIQFPSCSGSAIDNDGDGYAWENNQTCTVAQGTTPPATTPATFDGITQFPSCSSAVTDNDGDGYAWENNRTCRVSGSATPGPAPANVSPTNLALAYFPACSPSAVDENGDGYAWENNQTCVVVSNQATTNPQVIQFPTCSASAIDFDGDGYAWENNQTCSITANPNTTSAATQQNNPALAYFPSCSASAIDDNGDGYAWENYQTCVVVKTGASAGNTGTQTNLALAYFPACSASAIDDNGDGYAWENNQTCVVNAGAGTISFPLCSSNVVDENNDGYAWENNQSCRIQQ